jgi:hypothetical protein
VDDALDSMFEIACLVRCLHGGKCFVLLDVLVLQSDILHLL